jgi:hypothetical protein
MFRLKIEWQIKIIYLIGIHNSSSVIFENRLAPGVVGKAGVLAD